LAKQFIAEVSGNECPTYGRFRLLKWFIHHGAARRSGTCCPTDVDATVVLASLNSVSGCLIVLAIFAKARRQMERRRLVAKWFIKQTDEAFAKLLTAA